VAHVYKTHRRNQEEWLLPPVKFLQHLLSSNHNSGVAAKNKKLFKKLLKNYLKNY
jgi:hypothetical protein